MPKNVNSFDKERLMFYFFEKYPDLDRRKTSYSIINIFEVIFQFSIIMFEIYIIQY